MGIAVLVLGESGTGKSASMRNFKSGDISLFNVAGKPLPFKGRFKNIVNGDNYDTIKKGLQSMETKIAVVDDAQYLMANEFMRRGLERGYDKFTEIAMNFWDLVNSVNSLSYDTVVYFLSHIERDQAGNEKIKTIGKMLDEKITVEGMFTIVLKTAVKDGVYSFITQNNGHDTTKSPQGLFKSFEIPNDLKAVDDAIRKYYELDVPFTSEKEEEKERDDLVEQLKEKYEAPAEDSAPIQVEPNTGEVIEAPKTIPDKPKEEPVKRTRRRRE